jgi:hypothetical protein
MQTAELELPDGVERTRERVSQVVSSRKEGGRSVRVEKRESGGGENGRGLERIIAQLLLKSTILVGTGGCSVPTLVVLGYRDPVPD